MEIGQSTEAVRSRKLYHFTLTVRFGPRGRRTRLRRVVCLFVSSLVIFTSKQQYSAISRSRPSFHHFNACKPSQSSAR